MATSAANRGKWAEGKLRDYLKNVNEKVAAFDWLRLPDARSAMGRMAAMPADFEFFAPGVHGLIEVKETGHNFRLPKDKISQIPMLKRRILAGGTCLLIVYHSTTKLWRRVDVNDMPIISSGSWNLDQIPHVISHQLEEVLPIELLTGGPV